MLLRLWYIFTKYYHLIVNIHIFYGFNEMLINFLVLFKNIVLIKT